MPHIHRDSLTTGTGTPSRRARWRAAWPLIALVWLAVGCEPTPDPTPTEPTPNEPPSVTFGTGWLPSTPDALARTPLVAAAVFSGSALPSSVDLASQLPPVGDQGNQNSCVGWAVAYGMKTLHEFAEERLPLTDGTGRPAAARVFSPSFVYNQINRGLDQGSRFEDALELLRVTGAAPLADMPYNVLDFRSQPSASAISRAGRYRVEFWRRVPPSDLSAIRSFLAAGTPVLIGASLDGSFTRLARGTVWRARTGPVVGRHAMLVVGYDNARAAFKVMNSWGTAWADGGYGWIAYDLFPSVVDEAYITKDAPNGSPAPSPLPTPVPTERANFSVANVVHNQVIPGAPSLGMLLQGSLSVPAGGSAGRVQIVIFFHFQTFTGAKGSPVGARLPQYATVYGTAATGTPLLTLTSSGVTTSWTASLPYFALNVPFGAGPVTFLAEPVLFVDNFPVKSSGLIPFFATF